MGSRSYAAYYGVQPESSVYVQHVVDQGAVIVGKTKMGLTQGLKDHLRSLLTTFPHGTQEVTTTKDPQEAQWALDARLEVMIGLISRWAQIVCYSIRDKESCANLTSD